MELPKFREEKVDDNFTEEYSEIAENEETYE